MDCSGIEVRTIFYDHRENIMTYFTGEGADEVVSKLLSRDEIQRLKVVGGVRYVTRGNIVYEIDFGIPEDYDSTTLYYDPKFNMFQDDDGWTMYNIFSLVTPQQVMVFKNKKEDMIVYGKNKTYVELIYADY